MCWHSTPLFTISTVLPYTPFLLYSLLHHFYCTPFYTISTVLPYTPFLLYSLIHHFYCTPLFTISTVLPYTPFLLYSLIHHFYCTPFYTTSTVLPYTPFLSPLDFVCIDLITIGDTSFFKLLVLCQSIIYLYGISVKLEVLQVDSCLFLLATAAADPF